MKIALRIIDFFGVLAFSILFIMTFLSPKFLEDSAKEFVKHQVSKEISEQYYKLSDSTVATKAAIMAKRLGLEKSNIQADLRDKIPEKVAKKIASLCGYDCEKSKSVEKAIENNYSSRISDIELAQERLDDLIKDKYLKIVGELRLDLRIFLGVNLLAFMLLVSVSILKPQATKVLFLPSILLLISIILASCIYIFGKNWFHAILYNDYVGMSYLAYVAIIFVFLLDVAFNKAIATTSIVGAFLSAIALSLSSC